MKNPNKAGILIRGLAAGLTFLSVVSVSHAAPYASGLTNNNGTISFRLNATTTTNDSVVVISGGVTNVLQTPGGPVLTRGLVSTNLGIPTNAVFQVQINHSGSGVISATSPQIFPANANIRGVVVNRNPASPYFGWTYVSVGSGAPEGLFAYSADLADILGLGGTPRTGGYTFNASGFSPYKLSIDPSNDMVLVCDGSANTGGNLIEMTPQLTSFSYVLKQFSGTYGAGGPVGAANNHGEMAAGVIVGSGTNRVLYTMDEAYQTDPTSSGQNEWNSVWRYNIGTNSLPWGNAPDAKIMSPFLINFQGQNEGVQVGTNGFLYSNQRRSNPPQYSIYITDLKNLVDPATYFGHLGGFFWDTQTESLNEGYSDDITRDAIQIALSPDNQWLATLIAAGSGNITAPDGSVFANAANDIILFPLTNGIPNISARQTFHVGGAANGRDITFDAANNLVIGSSGLGAFQSYDIGQTATTTTGSDGTFSMVTPSTVVSAAATTPVAFQAGQVPSVVTFTRTGDTSNPLKVFFTLSGTAKLGTNANGGFIISTNATTTTNSVIIPAGSATATVSLVPTPANTPQLSLTAILTIAGSGNYSIGFPNAAITSIADNHTPELHILSISTNIYQGNLNDYATVTIERFGDTNITLTLNPGDFALGGSAVSNVDYYLTNLPLVIPAGTVIQTVNLLAPGSHGSTNIGQRTIVVTNLADAGAGYTVSNNVVQTTLTLQALPPGTVLYSQNFETDDSANWNVVFGTYNNSGNDFAINFSYDYTSGSIGNLNPIPAAPHSTNGDTHGLYMTVNKSAGVSSGLNAYLKGHTFGSNYAVRFDMFLVRNSSGTAQSQVEDALFGINHDGTHTNWFRNSVPGTSIPGSPVASDGLFFDVGADGNGGGGANTDFAAWSSPTYTNTVSVIGPTNFFDRLGSTLRQVFKKPPFNAGPNSSTGVPLGGSAANTILTTTPSWVQVEVSQVGAMIAWKINNTVIYSFTNVPTTGGASIYTNGAIMLGYDDPWDDVGNGSAGSGEACVIYDNLSVVSINPPVIVTQPTNSIAGVGGSAAFTVTASTSTGITNYQWQINGISIAGATNSSFSFTPVGGSFASNYSVLVNDGAYTVSSGTANVRPTVGTVFTLNPVSRAAAIGGSATFTATATTTSGQTNYQWFFNSNTITTGGATKTLSIANVQSTNFGPYYVTANDGFNPAVTSSVAQLTLALNPTIAAQGTVSNGIFHLSIPTQVGPSYVVQFATNLLGTNTVWTPFITNAGTGSSLTVTNVGTNVARFYRVKMQ